MSIFSSDWVPVWTGIAAAGTIVTALVTAAYTYFTLRLVRAQSEPNVIVYVKHDSDRPSLLVIVIENIGRDIAYDVAFKASRPIPERAFGITTPASESHRTMSEGPLVDGIPALGPSDSRVTVWGQYAGLSHALGRRQIVLAYEYRNGRIRYKKEARLEVESYRNTDASENPALSSAKSLKNMKDSLEAIARDVHALVNQRKGDGSQGEPLVPHDTSFERATEG